MKTMLYFSFLISVLISTSCSSDDEFEGKACFSYTPESEIKVGELITFSNCSDNAGFFLWNFGDNSTSTEKSPSHSYDEAGTYNVTLIVQDTEFIDLNGDMIIDEHDKSAKSDYIEATVIVTSSN